MSGAPTRLALAELRKQGTTGSILVPILLVWGQNMPQGTLGGGGAFTWNRIQRLYDADPAVHWQRCESEGLECPQEEFVQIFHLSRLSRQFLFGEA
jgi:hypothetical protein